MKGPAVSIVIVNLDGERFLGACLGSIYAQSTRDFEVVFVDNGSKDGSIGFVRKNFPSAVIVENGKNLGFAAGNNRAIEACRGEFVLTLNNDTELAPGFLERLTKAASAADTGVGMWAVKILSMEDKTVIDSVGGLLISPDCLGKGRGRLERDTGAYDAAEVFIPSACAALYRKKMLDEIGLFDEDFFAYCEDVDLGLRARLSGWLAASVPDAVVYHHYSGTGGKYSKLKAYLVERNHVWAAVKNLPAGRLLALPFHTVARHAFQLYGIFAGRGAGAKLNDGVSIFGMAALLVRALFDCALKLPAMFKKRAAVRKLRKVSSGEVSGWFKKHGISAAEIALKD